MTNPHNPLTIIIESPKSKSPDLTATIMTKACHLIKAKIIIGSEISTYYRILIIYLNPLS